MNNLSLGIQQKHKNANQFQKFNVGPQSSFNTRCNDHERGKGYVRSSTNRPQC